MWFIADGKQSSFAGAGLGASDVAPARGATHWFTRSAGVTVKVMCRNIRVLHNFDPPTTDDEVREAALQFVRKVSGSTRPSRANTEAFDRAVDEIAVATRRLLDDLVTKAPPKNRENEALKGRARHEKRMEREVRIRTAST